MVLSFLSLTTTPCKMRFGMKLELLSARRCGALGLHRPDAGDVAPDLTHPSRVLHLARGLLESQIELLLLELHQLVPQRIVGERPHVFRFHELSLRARIMLHRAWRRIAS